MQQDKKIRSCQYIVLPEARVSQPQHQWHLGRVVLCCGAILGPYRVLSSVAASARERPEASSQLWPPKMSPDTAPRPLGGRRGHKMSLVEKHCSGPWD